MKRWLMVAAALLLTALSLAAFGQAVFNGGRCDGSYTLVSGDHVRFTTGTTSPTPQYLFLLVNSGQGNVILHDGYGDTSVGLYFSAGDLLLLPAARSPFDLYSQATGIQIYYGGAIVGTTGGPICGTGQFGPVVVLTDQKYSLQMESASATSVQIGSFASVVATASGSLPYDLATGSSTVAAPSVPACSGTTCCSPTKTVFGLNGPGSNLLGVYTLFTGGIDFDYEVTPPVPLAASAQADPTSGVAPLAVAFTGKASGGSPPYTWDWKFGDGTAHKTVQNPSHTYQSAGTFQPVLTVTDSAGAQSQDKSLTITVSSALSVAAAGAPLTGDAPLAVSFTATGSGGTPPYTYAWNFGDQATGSGQTVSHTYTQAGTFHVSLTLTDSASATATDSHLVVQVSAPGALAAFAQADKSSGPIPLTVNFTGAASGGTAPYTWSWDFGDGSAPATTQNAQHTYSAEGTYTVTLTVQDSAGATATDGHLQITANSNFTVVASAVPTVGASPLTVAFTGTATGGSAPYQYAWSFGDGTTSAVQNPSHTYTSDGDYGVSLSASDSAGHTATDSHLIIHVGLAPGAPIVTNVQKMLNPFRLKIVGQGFITGCQVLIDGVAVPATYKSGTVLIAKKGAALKAMVPKGVAVCVTVTNPGGLQSACFSYTR
ncbi:MAG: PKD domain-containing protein [Acidobacteriota bacterium]